MKNIVALGCILTSISYSNLCATQNTPGVGNLSSLPHELIIDIFKRLDIKSTSRLTIVSEKFKELACSEEVQRTFESSPVKLFCQKDLNIIDFTEEVKKAALSVADDSNVPTLARLNACLSLYTIGILSKDLNTKKEYAQKYLNLYKASKNYITKFSNEDQEHLRDMKKEIEHFLNG